MPDNPPEEPPPPKRGSSDPHELFGLGFQATAKSSGGIQDWVAPTVEELQRGLPQYDIIAMIACGGMGAVYKARQKSLDRHVAIKILPAEIQQGDAQFAERFKREAQAMARLSHPGIVAVHDAGETTDGLLFFVMDFVQGTDVRQMVAARGSLPQEEALGITARVCEALAYAHGQGVIHRDIKPSNVIVDTEGRVRIADFGVAKMTSTDCQRMMTASNVALGTAEFMAPEAMTGTINVDHRADLYAVGVMLYQMLTGKIPRGRFDPASRLVPGLDHRIDRVIDRTLQSEPAARYSSAVELNTDLAWSRGAAITVGGGKSNRTPLLISVAFIAAVALAGWFGARAFVQKGSGDGGAHPLAIGEAQISFVAATKAAPFINSLGMKFVPVPITGGPTAGQRVLFSVWETRVQDYEPFVHETHRDWPKPGFEQDPTHPAVNVSWDDAQAFCAWLTEQERSVGRLGVHERYRLPGDHEWSCAVGLGDREDPARSPAEKAEELQDIFPWGQAWPPPRGAGNYSGAEAAGHETWREQTIVPGYSDPFPQTAPVGSFAANRFGLFDLGGNAWEWCEDLFQPGEPARVQRGASFNNGGRGGLFSAKRDRHSGQVLSENFGFRVVLGADQTRVGAPGR